MPVTIANRRQLLKGAGVGSLAAMSISTSLGATSQSEVRPRAVGQPMPGGVELPATPYENESVTGSVGMAVVGLGYYSLAQIMPRLVGNAKVHVNALVSGNRRKAQKVAHAYRINEDRIYDYASIGDLAAATDVEAVYIALPTGLHAEFALAAFEAGKHVICEKPMAISSAECEAMIAAAMRADRKLMIAYRCHFEPYNLKAMELTGAGRLGDLRVIRTNQQYVFGDATSENNWRLNRALAGGGPLEDYGLYGLQAAMYLSGEEPVRISASATQPADDPRFAEVFASTHAQLEFPSGLVAHISTSYDTTHSNRVVVDGTDARMVMDAATGYTGNGLTVSSGEPTRYEFGDSSEQFARQFEHFADAIRNGLQVKTPGEMGLRDIRLIEAIYRAAW